MSSIRTHLAAFLQNQRKNALKKFGLTYIIFSLCDYLWEKLFAPKKPKVSDDEMKVVIVGAGLSGICVGIKLKEAGIPFIILEKSPTIGGTWWYNTYPGCACDIPSHLYGYSFELNPNWSTFYPAQKEILTYMQRVVTKYNLTPHIRFNTEVKKASFEKKTSLWTVTTVNGDKVSGNILVSGVGGLHVPIKPEFKDQHKFKGKILHTAEWEHSYDYKGKNVAIIGSAASAVQVVPAIASEVNNLFIFQRTPNWIVPKPDFKYPQWLQTLYKKFPILMAFTRWHLYVVHELFFWLVFSVAGSIRAAFARWFLISYAKREIKDPELLKKVVPTYTMGCKRMLLAENYFRALQKGNVNLITEPIEKFYEKGIVTDEKSYDIDLIVLATGFHLTAGYNWIDVEGGSALAETFSKSGPKAYLGICLPGAPNLFFMIGPNSGLGHNAITIAIEAHADYVCNMAKRFIEKKIKSVEVKPAIMEKWNEKVQKDMGKRVWAKGNCKSWYQSKDGSVFALWSGYAFQFWLATLGWDENDWNIQYEKDI